MVTIEQKLFKLPSFHLTNKRVLLRVDLNVPIHNGNIMDDFRLHAILPTLNYLIEHQAIIILATHIGRPQGKKIPALSTQHLVPWFKKHGYEVIFEPNLTTAINTNYPSSSIILLENMRFYAGEQTQDDNFAQQLASCADYYINDAFATLHRQDVSVSLVARYFPEDKKSIGFLVKKELEALDTLKNDPAHPFLLILGGGKPETKISLIKGMLPLADSILLCPALVFTFLAAQHKEVGKSLIDAAQFEQAKQLMNEAQKNNMFHFPVDYQIALDSIHGPLEVVSSGQFPHNGIGIAIGPETIKLWHPLIQNAQTIFFNAAMGFAQQPHTQEALKTLLQCVAQSAAYSVVGGGDSVAAVQRYGLTAQIDFLSTGGGATLAYLTGKQLLGLQYL